ncbi:MAG: hypothetical protein HQL22_10330 [Candidatus Omnitrophica bacterium]|nr:hypothetical protein [Candidatus Omnitrophota bacterium]
MIPVNQNFDKERLEQVRLGSLAYKFSEEKAIKAHDVARLKAKQAESTEKKPTLG